MNDSRHRETLATFEKLQPGDLVELRHEVKVGFRTWQTTTRGRVVRAERRRHGLHFRRNFDDKVFSDILVLQREEDGELTTVTLDEFSALKRLNGN
jgi:ribosomal protein L34